MKSITEIGGVVTPNGVYTAYLARKLQYNYSCLMLEGKIYFLESLSKERLVSEVLGFVSREIRERVTGREPKTTEWPAGLWFGKREIHVELVKTGTEPQEFLFDNDESTLLVLDDGALNYHTRKAMVIRLFKAGLAAFELWERDAVRRTFRREQAVFSKPFIADIGAAPSAKPCRKRRVRPGELLPSAERVAMLEAGNDVLRGMLTDMPAEVPQPPSKPVQADTQTT